MEVDSLFPPVVHPPRNNLIAPLETAREKLTTMEENGMIFEEEEHTPWSTSTSKNNVRICIDPGDLTKALKRPHYPIVTVVACEQAQLCEFVESYFGSGAESEPARGLLIFQLHPFQGVNILSSRSKANV